MASTILSRTISSVVDQRIVLSNSKFARASNVGTSWTKLRISLRATLTDPGVSLTGTPLLAIGVCSGTTNIFGDATVTNFCGVVSSSATWTRFTSPFRMASFYTPAKMIGSTLTRGSQIGSSGCVLYDATAADRAFLLVDITKGSPNYTFNMFGNSTGSATDVDVSSFIVQSEAVTPVFTNSAFGTDQTLAVSESAGSFDHINVSWNQTAGHIELSDVKVVRLA